MIKSPKTIIIILAAIVLLLAAAVIFYFNENKEKEEEMSAVVEMMTYEKQKVEQEYIDLTFEFDGYTSNIKNDSLLKLLDNEKMKVQQLLDELRITKATDAKKIQSLKAELSSIRKVMAHLVTQIDSLNAENKVLKTENKEVKRQYARVSEEAEKLSKEKENLNEVVTRASRLEISGFNMVTLNEKNKKTTWFNKIAFLQFNYTIAKNITATTGSKTVYVRITRPDGDVLTKGSGQVFRFENRNIEYSAKKEIEYEGENLNDAIYWKVEEILQTGNYRADFFCDGNLIGSYSFNIKK